MIQVLITGGLTRDPVSRSTPNGKQVVNFDIASTPNSKKEGEKVEYFRCAAWGKTGEVIAQYCKKGSRMMVQGIMNTEEYEKQDGTKGFTLKVTIEKFEFIGGKKDESAPSEQGSSVPKSELPKSDEEIDLDDLPEIDMNEINVQMPF